MLRELFMIGICFTSLLVNYLSHSYQQHQGTLGSLSLLPSAKGRACASVKTHQVDLKTKWNRGRYYFLPMRRGLPRRGMWPVHEGMKLLRRNDRRLIQSASTLKERTLYDFIMDIPGIIYKLKKLATETSVLDCCNCSRCWMGHVAALKGSVQPGSTLVTLVQKLAPFLNMCLPCVTTIFPPRRWKALRSAPISSISGPAVRSTCATSRSKLKVSISYDRL